MTVVGLFVGFMFGIAWSALVKRGLRNNGHARLGRLALTSAEDSGTLYRRMWPDAPDARIRHLPEHNVVRWPTSHGKLTMGDE